MLELAVLVVSVSSVLVNYFLVRNLKINLEIVVPEPKVFVEIDQEPLVEEPSTTINPINDDSRYAWKNGKVETEPVKVGWRPSNNPPPPPGPMERPAGFAR